MPSEQQQQLVNKPRNLLILDATSELEFTLQRFGSPLTITIHQTADEATWPGGAVWDLGWCMAQMLVKGGDTITTTTSSTDGKRHAVRRRVPRNLTLPIPNKVQTVLELGCGVGLTGLVAAAALGPSLTILTDLQVVVDNVTRKNVESNTILRQKKHLIAKGGSQVVAMPLCWGNPEDEQAVSHCLGGKAPDLILIGDVAYQHKPGAPSHFDVLMSTLLRMADPRTLVVFGLRIRMPASMDLLLLFQEHFTAVRPALPVDEIEPTLGKVKHNMSIHFFRKTKT